MVSVAPQTEPDTGGWRRSAADRYRAGSRHAQSHLSFAVHNRVGGPGFPALLSHHRTCGSRIRRFVRLSCSDAKHRGEITNLGFASISWVGPGGEWVISLSARRLCWSCPIARPLLV